MRPLLGDRSTSSGLSGFRSLVLFVVGCLIAPPVFIAARAAGLSTVVGAVVSGVVVVLMLVTVARLIPGELPSAGGGKRILLGAWAVLSLIAAYQLAGLSVFMLDSTKQAYAVNPHLRPLADPDLSKPFFLRHNCFTSYVIGAYLAGQGADNIYDKNHYRDTEEPTAIHDTIGERHTIDVYQYPPPFLVLPKLLLTTGGDFFEMRAYWYALNVLVIIVTVGALVLWIGRREFNVYWLALPMVFLTPNMHGTLQIGNAHFLIICLALLGMLAFEKKINWLGGVLLGLAIVSKIFPAVLLAYLLVRRAWRPVAWTLAGMAGLAVAVLLIFGEQPYRAFLEYQLPRLANGDAFWFARENIRAILGNLSVMGVVYKLHTLDLSAQLDPAWLSSALMWLFSAVLVMVIAATGWRDYRRGNALNRAPLQPFERLDLARIWVVLLILGQLRSPFLPFVYGGIAIVLLIALLLPVGGRWVGRGILVALLWLLYSIGFPLPYGSESVSVDLMVSLLPSLVALALCLFTVVRHTRRRCSADESEVDLA